MPISHSSFWLWASLFLETQLKLWQASKLLLDGASQDIQIKLVVTIATFTVLSPISTVLVGGS